MTMTPPQTTRSQGFRIFFIRCPAVCITLQKKMATKAHSTPKIATRTKSPTVCSGTATVNRVGSTPRWMETP